MGAKHRAYDAEELELVQAHRHLLREATVQVRVPRLLGPHQHAVADHEDSRQLAAPASLRALACGRSLAPRSLAP
eukprot:COSAG01_NODE_1043_length_11954_cov_9.077014_13_plen_75_part_00